MFKDLSKNILLGLIIFSFCFLYYPQNLQAATIPLNLEEEDDEPLFKCSNEPDSEYYMSPCPMGWECPILYGVSALTTEDCVFVGLPDEDEDDEEEDDPIAASLYTDPVLENPLDSDAPTVIGRVIDAILGLVGSLALIMFIYGGLIWMTAAGNDQKVTKGKNIVLWAALGLVVVFSAYALVKFLFSSLGV
jgi:hypothetical protein